MLESVSVSYSVNSGKPAHSSMINEMNPLEDILSNWYTNAKILFLKYSSIPVLS